MSNKDLGVEQAIRIDGAANIAPEFSYLKAIEKSLPYIQTMAGLVLGRVSKKHSKKDPFLEFRVWVPNDEVEPSIYDDGMSLVVPTVDFGRVQIPADKVGLGIRMSARIAMAKGWTAVKITVNSGVQDADVAFLVHALGCAGIHVSVVDIEGLPTDKYSKMPVPEFGEKTSLSELRRDWQVPFWIRADTDDIERLVRETILHIPAAGLLSAEKQIAARKANEAPEDSAARAGNNQPQR